MKLSNFDPQVLAKALKGNLPGVEAQLSLSHPARTLSAPQGVTPREAGVLVLLYEEEESLKFPLIVRTSHNPNDRHGGQVSLPGGKRESTDSSLIDTALREAEEEIGVDKSAVHVLGQLSTLYIPVSNFNVFPTVGYIEKKPDWVPQTSEVDRVLEALYGDLIQESAVKYTERNVGKGVKLNNVPYFELAGEVVWGATAMILSELRQLLRQQ